MGESDILGRIRRHRMTMGCRRPVGDHTALARAAETESDPRPRTTSSRGLANGVLKPRPPTIPTARTISPRCCHVRTTTAGRPNPPASRPTRSRRTVRSSICIASRTYRRHGENSCEPARRTAARSHSSSGRWEPDRGLVLVLRRLPRIFRCREWRRATG